MALATLINSNWYTYLIIPFLIFIARIIDVSIGTVRLIFISKGYRYLAPVLGFFEVLVWLGAIQQILLNLTNAICYIAYAGGFATGTYVGIIIEERLSVGKVIIRTITHKDSSKLLEALQQTKHVVTSTAAESVDGEVRIIFMVTNRKDIPKIIKLIKTYSRDAFYIIEDVRFAKEDDYQFQERAYIRLFKFFKKGK